MTSGVDAAGPIFISHRGDDGTDAALDIARRLRSSGVPVWLDVDDLPPGDIEGRLEQALAGGLAGGVVIVTPNVTRSKVMREQELPALFALADDRAFTLAIVNELADPADPKLVDRGKPSELLDPDGRHPELEGLKQYSSIDGTLGQLGRWFARRRLELLRGPRSTDPLTIDVQTRIAAAGYRALADLIFRSAPPPDGQRVPSRTVWYDLQAFLSWLPSVLANVEPPEIVLSGGSHLAAAVAFGAALPETVGIPVALTTSGGLWRLAQRGHTIRERLPIIGVAPRTRTIMRARGPALAVFVDVAHSHGPVDSFDAWARNNRDLIARALVISQHRRLDPHTGPLVARSIALRIRREARVIDTRDLLLFVRAPWPLAVLLGMSLNTLTLRLYEWEDATTPPSYVPAAVVRSGSGGSPVIEVAGAPAMYLKEMFDGDPVYGIQHGAVARRPRRQAPTRDGRPR